MGEFNTLLYKRGDNVSNNNEILNGLNELLKNVDLEQLTSMISNLNIKDTDKEGTEVREKPLTNSKLDLSSLNSLMSNIDLEEMRSLLSGLNFDYLKNLGLLNSKSTDQKSSGLFNTQDLETALNEITKRMQKFNK